MVLADIRGAAPERLDTATKPPGIAGYGMVYCRSAPLGLWIILGAPFLFCRLGLMSRA